MILILYIVAIWAYVYYILCLTLRMALWYALLLDIMYIYIKTDIMSPLDDTLLHNLPQSPT